MGNDKLDVVYVHKVATGGGGGDLGGREEGLGRDRGGR